MADLMYHRLCSTFLKNRYALSWKLPQLSRNTVISNFSVITSKYSWTQSLKEAVSNCTINCTFCSKLYTPHSFSLSCFLVLPYLSESESIFALLPSKYYHRSISRRRKRNPERECCRASLLPDEGVKALTQPPKLSQRTCLLLYWPSCNIHLLDFRIEASSYQDIAFSEVSAD